MFATAPLKKKKRKKNRYCKLLWCTVELETWYKSVCIPTLELVALELSAMLLDSVPYIPHAFLALSLNLQTPHSSFPTPKEQNA